MDQDLLAYLDQRFSSIDRRFEEMGQRLDSLETDVRKTWVSIEDVRGQVRLVAEGVASNYELLGLHRIEVSRRFDELENLTHKAYADLDERVQGLEATG
jgi:hypothetical protein